MAPSFLTRLRSVHRDERGVVAGLILKVAVATAVLAVVMNDGGQILRAQVKAESAARAAAGRASQLFTRTHDQERASFLAAQAAQEVDPQAVITKIEYEQDGQASSATVTVTERAVTVVAGHLSFMKGVVVQRAVDRETFGR